MPYDTAAARREMLAEIARATEELAVALAALGEAYEQLDEANAERLERELFGPVQTAYGRAQRTYAGFAQRAGLPPGSFPAASAGHPSQGASGFLQTALAAVTRADLTLSELQDSMRPVEVGDPELRAGLSEVRRLLADVPVRTRDFTRTLGR
jgi:hypothetical protein